MSQQHPYSSPARPPTNNAFSVVMHAQQHGRNTTPVDFSEVLAEFQQSLGEDDGIQVVGEQALGTRISAIILKMVREKVVPQAAHQHAHIDTKINALHLLVDTAMGVAYAPQEIVSDSVRAGPVPAALIQAMYEILDTMTDYDVKSLTRDEVAFLDKIKELRHNPRELCDPNTWKHLDDVLRLLRYSGEVDFKKPLGIIKGFFATGLTSAKNSNSDFVVRIIRNSIVSYILPSSCFKTKINALNALADIGMCLMEAGPWGDEAGSAEKYLCNTMLNIAKPLSEQEVGIVAAEMRALEPEMSPELSDSLDYSDHSPYHNRLRILVRGLSPNELIAISHGLFAKILYLRWIDGVYSERWNKCWSILDNLVDLFIDSSGSVPLSCDRLLNSLNRVFNEADTCAYSPAKREEAASEVKLVVDNTIERLARRGAKEACFETKFNVLKALPQIGMRIVHWELPNTPVWKTRRFNDQMSEILLCSAMVSICGSFSRKEWTGISSDVQLRNEVSKLNLARMQAPGAFPGFEDIVRLFLGTTITGGVKANGQTELIDVVDLSED